MKLEVLQANDGDCLLLHTDGGDLILIDGGSAGVYRTVLKKRLEQLRGSSPKLDLRLVMVSHIDSDHITGIADMLRDLVEKQADEQEARYRIRSLWHNSFDKLAGGHSAATQSSIVGASLGGVAPAGLDHDVAAVIASVKQGNDLRSYAKKLAISVNRETGGELVRAPDAGRKVIPIAAGLTFTILGPREAELEALEDSWKAAKKTGGANEESVAADYLNRTVPNLSSIVVLAEAATVSGIKRLLLTGDAGGDLILEGLESAGLLDSDGRIAVDLLKVQHHGSNHSVDIEFFRRVTAPRYVISGNGRHGIPHRDTLEWLSEARAGKAFDAYLTNRTADNGLTEMFDEFLADEAAGQPLHHWHFREDAALAIPVDL
jgi:beta-lactamase superfamily II metal-dependent hydrolase